MNIAQLIDVCAQQLEKAGVAFGHGTTNAHDEATWLVLWRLGLPLDSDLNAPEQQGKPALTMEQQVLVAALMTERISSRKPAAYLTQEAWLQGVPFYVDERAIVPRSLIAELLVDGSLDYWLSDQTHQVLDLCTGNGSLAVLAAMAWPDVHVLAALNYPDIRVTASDISEQALEVARINVDKHALSSRIQLLQADGLPHNAGPFVLILCNPPYVSASGMHKLPPEYLREPRLALDGNTSGSQDGMDFIRPLLAQAAAHMRENAVLVLEIGNERAHFETAYPRLEAVWLETSAGEDQVLLLTRQSLLKA